MSNPLLTQGPLDAVVGVLDAAVAGLDTTVADGLDVVVAAPEVDIRAGPAACLAAAFPVLEAVVGQTPSELRWAVASAPAADAQLVESEPVTAPYPVQPSVLAQSGELAARQPLPALEPFQERVARAMLCPSPPFQTYASVAIAPVLDTRAVLQAEHLHRWQATARTLPLQRSA